MTRKDILDNLRGKLIVSCQPVPGGAFDSVASVVAYAQAAEASGAKGLRIEGAANVASVTRESALPIIGLIKRDLDDSPVRITPFLDDVETLCGAGADIVAIDGTDRQRPVPAAELITEIKRRGRIAMADISTLAEAHSALAAGADIIGTTMSGYTGKGPTPQNPDLDLVAQCSDLGGFLIAEGRYNSPQQAGDAIRAGADAVVVGSAITRPEYIISWFRKSIESATELASPVLAFDIGGTKALAALVRGSKILERRVMATPTPVGGEEWIEAVTSLALDWKDRYRCAAIAVTGRVEGEKWTSLNPGTLSIPHGYPLERMMRTALGVPVEIVNDAQAAAWGEYRFGAARGRDMVFLTISSGIGGGIVLNGRLLRGTRGIAGSLGQVMVTGASGFVRLETLASGFGIARKAFEVGHSGDARLVFSAAAAGEDWAQRIVQDAASQLAAAVVGLQAVVDPECIVIGGGVGLSDSFLDLLREALADHPSVTVPELVAARLGADAGIIGVADLATTGCRHY